VIPKRAPIVVILAALLALSAAGCGRQQNKTVAKVDGSEITQDMLFEALAQADNGDAGRRSLDALIVRQLLRKEAEKRGIKIDKETLQDRIDGLKDYVLAATGKDFEAWLEDTGQTEQDVASRVTMQLLTAALVLTDQDKRDYFEASKERLKDLPHGNESVIYRHIVVGTKEEAEAVRKELLASASDGVVSAEQFAKVAEERSFDPMTRTRGGMVGWMLKGKSESPELADPELEKVLFSLKPGEVSQPLAVSVSLPSTDTGQAPPEPWRIVRVDKHIMPQEMTLEANEDVVEDWMLNDPTYQLQLQQFFENLRSKAKVEVVDPRYRAVGEAYRQRQQSRSEQSPQMPVMAAPQGSTRGRAPTPAPPARQGPANRAGGR